MSVGSYSSKDKGKKNETYFVSYLFLIFLSIKLLSIFYNIYLLISKYIRNLKLGIYILKHQGQYLSI